MDDLKKEINEVKQTLKDFSTLNGQNQKELAKLFVSSFEKLFQKLEAMQIESNQEIALYMNRRIDNLYKQVDALTSIHSIINFRYPLPQMRGWPVSPDFANLILQTVLSEKPAKIVEMGSGISSILIGYVLESLGKGKLITLDHDRRFQEQTQNELRNHKLTSYVQVEFAPLVEYDIQGQKWLWYDTHGINDLEEIDILIVDGPPAETQKFARFPAFPLLRENLSSNCIILTDDGNRDEEKMVIEKWAEIDRGIKAQYFDTEKGAYIIHLDKDF